MDDKKALTSSPRQGIDSLFRRAVAGRLRPIRSSNFWGNARLKMKKLIYSMDIPSMFFG
jgi:hypothetical protein